MRDETVDFVEDGDPVKDCDLVEDGDFVEDGGGCSAILHPCGILDTHKDHRYDDEERRKPNRYIEQ